MSTTALKHLPETMKSVPSYSRYVNMNQVLLLAAIFRCAFNDCGKPL